MRVSSKQHMPRWQEQLHRRWRDLSFLHKILVALSIPVAVTMVLAVTFILVERLEVQAVDLVQEADQTRELTNRMVGLAGTMDLTLAEYANGERPESLGEFTDARAQFGRLLSELDQRVRDSDANSGRLVSLRALLGDLGPMVDRLPGDGRAADHAQVATLVASIHDTVSELRQTLITIRSADTGWAMHQATVLEETREELLLWVLLGCLTVLGLSVWGAYRLVRRLVQRVNLLEENARRAEQREPLLPGEPGGDEIGRLGKALWQAATVLAQREQEARDAHDFLEYLIETGPMVVFRVDPRDNAMTYISHNAERLLGFSREELLADPHLFTRQVLAEDLQQARVVLREAVDRQTGDFRVEYRFRHSDGTYRWLYGYGRVILGPDGRPEELTGYAIDVTDRKEAELAAEQAKEEALKANQAKSDFLSRMSHELRTPMNAILGFSQLLELEPLTPEGQEGLAYVRKAGDHLLALINEVLDISRIEAGRIALALEPVALCAAGRTAVELVRPMAAAQSVTIACDRKLDDAVRVLADEQRLRQVMLNLLSNAIKYNKPGGRVALSAELLAGERVRIQVADTGKGIAPEYLTRIFEPFERLDAAASGVEGTGIGLFLSKRLVEAMHGTIGLKSEVGVGSTFWIELPLAGSTIETPKLRIVPEPAPAAVGGDGEQPILYVEDDAANLALLERLVANSGLPRLVTAMQGQMGLDLARQHRPSLILLDLHLPDLSGEEVLRRLKADPVTAAIPVVILSADAVDATIQRLRKLGASDYLTKPLDLKHLQSTIATQLAEGEPNP